MDIKQLEITTTVFLNYLPKAYKINLLKPTAYVMHQV